MIESQITREVDVRQAIQTSTNGSTAYATSDDFRRLFSDEMDSFYLLALLLTADARKAEECFVAGISDSVEGNPVFRRWASSWARRTIILHAIRMIEPAKQKSAAADTEPVELDLEPRLMAVLKLEALERFVFVISVLEGYSYQDCSILLGCSRQTVVNARARALEHLANAAEIVTLHREGLQSIIQPVSHYTKFRVHTGSGG
jgi:DNA-directed RNA polymerase specialized sigma24 family protein